MEKSPADRVDLQKEIGNKKALIMYSLPVTCANSPSGTPAAFSGTCSEQHLPGFFSKLSQLRDKGIQEVFVISANDPFVMNAWKKSLGGDPSVSPTNQFKGIKGANGRCAFWRTRKGSG
jgi:2-Cys peroxiredoxin 5